MGLGSRVQRGGAGRRPGSPTRHQECAGHWARVWEQGARLVVIKRRGPQICACHLSIRCRAPMLRAAVAPVSSETGPLVAGASSGQDNWVWGRRKALAQNIQNRRSVRDRRPAGGGDLQTHCAALQLGVSRTPTRTCTAQSEVPAPMRARKPRRLRLILALLLVLACTQPAASRHLHEGAGSPPGADEAGGGAPANNTAAVPANGTEANTTTPLLAPSTLPQNTTKSGNNTAEKPYL